MMCPRNHEDVAVVLPVLLQEDRSGTNRSISLYEKQKHEPAGSPQKILCKKMKQSDVETSPSKKNSLCPGHVGPQRLSQLAKQESAVERNGRIFEINHTHLQSLTRNLKNDQWLTLVQRLIHTQQATFELFTFEVLRY